MPCRGFITARRAISTDIAPLAGNALFDHSHAVKIDNLPLPGGCGQPKLTVAQLI